VQLIDSDLEYEVTSPITLQVIDCIKIRHSAQVGPSTSWALVLCTCWPSIATPLETAVVCC